jgi:protocatechuate 3,4-dioxygenase beta subunit
VRHILTSVFCVCLASAQAPDALKTGRIEGQVRTVAGAPVPRATIQLVSSGNGASATMLIDPVDGSTLLAGQTTTTDDSGKFVLENVPPGRNYRLSAMRPGYATGFYGTRSTTNPPVLLTLNAGETLRDLVIEMLEQGTVTGRVTDADGDPVVGALVTISQPRYNRGERQMASVAAQTTDDRGVYRFASLNPGRYYLVASDQTNRKGETQSNFKSGQQANIRTYYPSAEDVRDARAIEVPGDRTQSSDIVMRRAGTFALRGTATDADTGAPLIGLNVNVVSWNGASIRANPYSRQTRPPDGAFDFTGMPSGSYLLEIVLPANAPDRTKRIGRAEATILNTDLTGVVLRVGRGASVRGLVRTETGDLPASFFSVARSVMLTEDAPSTPRLNAPRSNGRIARDDTFAIEGLPASRYLVGFTALPEDVYVKSIKFNDSEILHSLLDLTSGGGGSLTVTLSNKPATITGSARDPKGEVVKGMAVALWPKEVDRGDPSGGIRRAVTDQSGTYRFAALPPGEYYVAAFPGVEQGLLESHEFVGKFNGDAEVVVVAEGSNSAVDAKLVPGDKVAAETAKLL